MTARWIAGLGYPALAVAYFDEPGQPAELQNVPVDPVLTGLEWLHAQDEVDTDALFTFGVSRGGELALWLAAEHPELVAGAFAPVGSGYLVCGFPEFGRTRVDAGRGAAESRVCARTSPPPAGSCDRRGRDRLGRAVRSYWDAAAKVFTAGDEHCASDESDVAVASLSAESPFVARSRPVSLTSDPVTSSIGARARASALLALPFQIGMRRARGRAQPDRAGRAAVARRAPGAGARGAHPRRAHLPHGHTVAAPAALSAVHHGRAVRRERPQPLLVVPRVGHPGPLRLGHHDRLARNALRPQGGRACRGRLPALVRAHDRPADGDGVRGRLGDLRVRERSSSSAPSPSSISPTR